MLVQPAYSILSPDLPVIFLSTFVLAYVFYKLNNLTSSTSTGPIPPSIGSLPVVGSIPYLPELKKLHHFFMEKRSMGPVLGFKTLSQYNVVLQTREAIAEAFSKAEVSNRPIKAVAMALPAEQQKGFFEPYGANFRKFHQSTLAILRQFGFGKLGGVMEARIQNAVADIVTEFQALEDRPIDPTDSLQLSIMNVMASILFGKTFGKGESLARDILQHNDDMLRVILITTQITLIPAFRFIPYYRRAIDEMRDLFKWFNEVYDKKITECEQDKDEVPCFIRSCIEAEGKDTYDRQQLCLTLFSLTLAGSETTSTSLRWFIAVLANHPDIQLRLQEEIDEVVPRERLPSLSDRSQLKFVEATMLELMRYKTIGPLGLPHETSKDTVVQGFFIPAHTTVIPLIYAVHMDRNIWGDPDTFRPDRFIDQEGNFVNKEYVIPFSIGKRSCLGEQLARQEMFLFLSGLLQNFTFLPPEGCDSINCAEQVVEGSVAPYPYKVRFIRRKMKNNSYQSYESPHMSTK